MATCDASQILANAISAGYARLSKRDLVAICASWIPSVTLEASSQSLGYSKLSEYDTAECVVQALCTSPGTSNTADQIIASAQANKIDQLSRRDLDAVQVALLCTKTNPPCVTPTAPNSVQASAAHVVDPNTQVNVRWLQPANTGSLITGYEVFWGTTMGGPYPNNSGTLPLTPKNYTATGLTAGTTYYFVVQALTVIGGCVSANSNEANATTSGSSICAGGVAFASAWALRVVANGGASPSVHTQNAIATYWCTLNAAGLDVKMKYVLQLVNDNLTACLTPLFKGASGDDPAVNHNFVAGDRGANGLTGNASTKYLETGMVPQIEMSSQFDAGFGVYAYNTTTTGFNFGSYDGSTDTFMGASSHSDGKAYSYNGNETNNVISPATAGNGFYATNRLNATDHRLFFASSVSAFAQLGPTDAVNDVTSLPAFQAYVMATSDAGVPQFHCSDTLSHIAVWEGFSTVDVQTYFNAVQTLLVALGGGSR